MKEINVIFKSVTLLAGCVDSVRYNAIKTLVSV